MFYTIVGAGAASRYGSGSNQKMRLLAASAPAPQHCEIQTIESESLALVCEPHTGGDLVPVEVTGTIILNCRKTLKQKEVDINNGT
jgi:hypothetical protein